MRFHSVCGLAAAALLSLAACGGSGNPGSRPTPTPGEIRELTGLSAPAETGAAQQERRPGLFSRADSLIISTMHVEAALPAGTRAFRLVSECSGPRCELLDPVSGETDAISLGAVAYVPGDAETIGSAHGITLMSESGHHMGVDKTSLGAWMTHGAFVLEAERSTGEEAETHAVYALALGGLTARPPSGSAAWTGLMVGAPVAGDDKGDRLVGTAELIYDLAGGGLAAAFGGIRNIDRGRAHSIGAVVFSNIAVGPDGTFATGQSGSRIQGGFYGPDHAEAAGIFEQSDIVGAFGATRQWDRPLEPH